jgi:hypothetical protein
MAGVNVLGEQNRRAARYCNVNKQNELRREESYREGLAPCSNLCKCRKVILEASDQQRVLPGQAIYE